MKQNKIFLSFLIILVLLASRYTSYFYAYCIFGIEDYRILNETFKTVLIQTSGVLLPVLMVLAFNHFSIKKTLEDLGLSKGIKAGFIYALIIVSPMFIGNLFFSPLRSEVKMTDIINNSIWPGFNEELIFRGILIGQLFKRASWGFVPAALLSSLYFALGHLYQSHDVMSAIQIFAITAGAGVGFALCFIEWSWNLWLVMFVHMLMNLHTVFFDTGGTAALNVSGNVFRFMTIAILVIFTLRRMQKNGSYLKGNLWLNKSN
jgi:membrane protease YdiL (CAAX protease family)